MPPQQDTEDAPLLGEPGDASQTAEQGLQYNLIIGTAILAQAGIWILAALVWASVFMTHLMFFSVHPLVNSAGLLLLTQSILVLQPTHTPKQKITGTQVHFALNLVGVSALIVGLVIIEINKASHPETRFTSVHGIMGLTTYIIIFLQALIGFTQFYIPSVFGGVDNAKMLYKYHRASGYVALLMGLATVCAATQTGFNKNLLHMRLWAVLIASILVVIGIAPRIRKSKFGL